MIDRLVEYPNRFKMEPVVGQADVYDIFPEPGQITLEGTPLNKVTLMKDLTSERYGLTPEEGTLNAALERNVQEFRATVTTNWVAEGPGFTQTISIPGMRAIYNPVVWLINEGATAEEIQLNREQYAVIYRLQTLDDAIKLYASDKSDLPILIGLKGV